MPRAPGGPAPSKTPAPLAWRSGPTLLFAGMLVTLLTIGLVVWNAKPSRPFGLPDDPAVADARALLAGGIPIPTPAYLLVTTLAGASPAVPPDSVPIDRLAAARGRLREAETRHPGDPRLVTAIAHVDLAAGRFTVAEHGYRAALRSASGYDEARLGLAVTLAMLAEQEAEPVRVRAKRLAALGQLANIENTDPNDDAVFRAAIANRITLLRMVGREAEAGRVASGTKAGLR